MIIEAVLLALAVSCALLALSGYVLTARTKGGWREPASWCGPLAFTSAALALLTAAGVLGLTAGFLLSLVPLLALAVMLVPAWRDVKRQKGAATATAVILGRVGGRIRDALWNAREDARDLGGKLRPAPSAPAPAVAQGTPRWPAGPRPAAVRQVPSPLSSAAPGDMPSPPEVAASLEASGAMVSPEAAALAERIAEFDPDDDEDELLEFVATLAADWLVISDAFPDLAETLLTGAGLDPGYAMGFIDIGDDVAELASRFAALNDWYHDFYGDIHEHVEDGRTLPHNARRWFHAHGGAPEGGAAA